MERERTYILRTATRSTFVLLRRRAPDRGRGAAPRLVENDLHLLGDIVALFTRDPPHAYFSAFRPEVWQGMVIVQGAVRDLPAGSLESVVRSAILMRGGDPDDMEDRSRGE